jgi:hypothetical protein
LGGFNAKVCLGRVEDVLETGISVTGPISKSFFIVVPDTAQYQFVNTHFFSLLHDFSYTTESFEVIQPKDRPFEVRV